MIQLEGMSKVYGADTVFEEEKHLGTLAPWPHTI